MNQASVVDRAAPPTDDPPWQPPDRRRTLQLVLATLWLIDAVLQLQPYMFSKSFGLFMLGPTAVGNPAPIGHPITDVARSISHHSVGANSAFVVIQFLIAFGIANRRTVRVGLVGSVLWSLLVWWLGEGLGGVLAGGASPLTGAPGAVILYAIVAVLLWPSERSGLAFVAAGPIRAPVAKAVWLGLWGALGTIALVGSATRHPARLLGGMEAGEPGWLISLDHRLVEVTTGQGVVLAVLTGVVLIVIGLAVLAPAGPARVLLGVAIVVGVVVWVTGENFGELFSGSATDPNTGPLLVLVALAYWPLARRRPDPVTAPEPVAEVSVVP